MRALGALGVGALIAVVTSILEVRLSVLPRAGPVAAWTVDRDAHELCGLDREVRIATKVQLAWPFAVRARPDGGAWVLCSTRGTARGACRLERVRSDGTRAFGVELGRCTALACSATGGALVIEGDRLLGVDADGGTSVVLEARALACAADAGGALVAGTSLGEIHRIRGGVHDVHALGRAVIDVAPGPAPGSAWVLLDAGGATLGLLDAELALRWTVPTELRCAHVAPVPGEERVWIADTERARLRRFGPGGILELDRSELPLAGLDRVVPWREGGALLVAVGAILRVDRRGRLTPGQGGFACLTDIDRVPGGD